MKRVKNKAKPTRVPQREILSFVRGLIVKGSLKPGDRLPTQEGVASKFGTSSLTVKRAFRELAAQGFSRSVPKIGRFVADRPPHLSRYALVFANAPGETAPLPWSRFDAAVVQAARTVAKQDGIDIAPYFGVTEHADSEGYQSIMRDVENQRLAGIIFTFAPHLLEPTPLIANSKLPMVNSDPNHGPFTRVVDVRGFLYRSLNRLLAEGRNRIAVITKPDTAFWSGGFPDEFEAAATSRGAITHPFWTQAVQPHHTKWVRHAVDAILSTHAAEPPDSLLITDDHLVEPVADALEEFGLRVPEQMRVIGHWNFPLKYQGRVPIELLGFDAHEVVRTWVATIDAQRRGEKIAPLATVPPRFSWELPQEISVSTAAGEPAAMNSNSTKSHSSSL